MRLSNVWFRADMAHLLPRVGQKGQIPRWTEEHDYVEKRAQRRAQRRGGREIVSKR
jgi:hypothetical protein